MTHDRGRRTFLAASGVAAATALGGCLFGGGGSSNAGPGRPYELVASNRLAAEDLEHEGVATVAVTVDRQVEGDNEVLFERTLDLAPGDSRSFEDAFETDDDGSAYVLRAELDPAPFYSDPGPQMRRRSLRAGYRFVPGRESAPPDGRLEAGVVDSEDDPAITAPAIRVGPPAWIR
jgi:hypothetical protein